MIPWFQEALVEKIGQILHMHLIRSTTIYWIEKQQMMNISAGLLGRVTTSSGFFSPQDVWFYFRRL